jgi:hypothetical protein
MNWHVPIDEMARAKTFRVSLTRVLTGIMNKGPHPCEPLFFPNTLLTKNLKHYEETNKPNK